MPVFVLAEAGYPVFMSRTRQFDVEALTSAALDQFWSNGYESTSIATISATTGVGNGSIYGAYGSKRGLYLDVLTTYCASRVDIVRAAMDAGDSLEASIRRFLDVIVADCATQPGRRGCLMLNTITEWGSRDAAILELCQRTTHEMEAVVAGRILAERSDVAQASASVLAGQIILMSQGLIALSRLDTPRDRLAAIADTYCESLAV